MSASDLLWQLNGEYRKRLTLAYNTLALLEGHLRQLNADSSACETLRWAAEQINTAEQEHRQWRHTYYYESPESKRMVQDERGVAQALSIFHRLRQRHTEQFGQVSDALGTLDRPPPPQTLSSSGEDLWARAEQAFGDLQRFDDFVRRLAQP
jgi:hypothetical protein